MTQLRSRLAAPVLVSAATLVHVTLMYKAALRYTGGTVSYPVDDTFIHLALAKQLATTGVYGLTPHEFTAASSSIAWPFLLAFAMKIGGVTAWLPIVLNGAFAVGLFFAVDYAVRRFAPEASVVARVVVGLLVMALTPTATLIVLGMEHTAHAAATIVFITVATSWLADPSDSAARPYRALPIAGWAAAMTMWRYEGIFPIALVFALALLRRRLRGGAIVAAGGALPIVLFGIYSIAHGAHFLPTPVLLKGRHFDLKDATALFDLLGGDVLDRYGTEGYALAVALAVSGLAFVVMRRDGAWTASALALVVTLGMVSMHLGLASVGWFFRYESYLLATGVTLAGATLVHLLPPRAELWRLCRARPAPALAAAAGILILTAPMWRRALQANDQAPHACRNIYEQQMQNARFLAAHFPNQPIAVNDIGAVAWAGNDRVIDLVGLATLPIAEAKGMKIDAPLPRADLVRLTPGVKVAIIYDEWFKESLPGTWLRVGRWTINNSRSPAFPTVAIYATEPSAYPAVIEALRAFGQTLPARVRTEGRYTDLPTSADRLRARDRIALSTSNAEVSGIYVIADDGTIPVVALGPAVVRGLTTSEAPAEIQKQLKDAKSPLRNTTMERAARVATRQPSVHVGGSVLKSGELLITPLTIDAAITASGPLPSANLTAAWVWRERAEGFVKLTRAELVDGALLDGDIVVVP